VMTAAIRDVFCVLWRSMTPPLVRLIAIPPRHPEARRGSWGQPIRSIPETRGGTSRFDEAAAGVPAGTPEGQVPGVSCFSPTTSYATIGLVDDQDARRSPHPDLYRTTAIFRELSQPAECVGSATARNRPPSSSAMVKVALG
jgi:hypothetical protein